MIAESDCFVSVVAPLFNDGAIVESFVDDVLGVLAAHYANYELVLIDDGSEDDLRQRVERLMRSRPCIRLIRLSRHFGEEIAITAGLDSVIGDFVVVMMPDTDPPALIPTLIAQARGGVEILLGTHKTRRRESLCLKVGSRLFHWYCRAVLRIQLLRGGTAFRVLHRRAVTALTRIRDRHRYLRFMSVQIGYTTQSFVYEPLNRGARPRARRLVDAVDMAMNVIMNTTRHPLRCVSWLGICASVANVIYALYVAYSLVLGDDLEPGWASLCLQNASMFFFVFLILTVLSEYIGYLSLETRQRPLYHILDESHSDAILPQAVCRNVVREAAERSAP